MRKETKIIQTPDFFLKVTEAEAPIFEEKDYLERLGRLLEKMHARGVTHTVVYADREHFANMEYLTGFEPRFEEALLIVDEKGGCTLAVGNECMPYSYISPLKMNRVLYQNFSLQGQPRDRLRSLKEILAEAGIGKASKVGVAGYKYFESAHISGDPEQVFDIPCYIMDELRATECAQIVNFTREFTGMPDGIRMTVRTAKEVAWAEYTACKTAGIVQRMFGALRPDVSELELSLAGQADFSPVSVFPMINFGKEHSSVGLRSPGTRRLRKGEPCGLCYGIRGALTSRVGLAAEGESTLLPGYEGVTDRFYKPFWRAIAAWYESIYIGASAAEAYKNVMDIIGGQEFGVVLNPGHYIGGDEWVNSPFAKDSDFVFRSSAHLQCDIIVSSGNPVMSGICEDGVVVADKALRTEIAAEYPEVWSRIQERQRWMRDVMGIDIKDDLLPLSNLNGVFFPYMLNTGLMFALGG